MPIKLEDLKKDVGKDDKLMTSGIYCIENINNKKKYVGQSANLESRKKDHFRSLSKNRHKNGILQRAWNKWGKDSFVFYVLDIAEREALADREQFWMDTFRVYDRRYGYNMCLSSTSVLGIKRSPETCVKIGLINKGKKRSNDFGENIRRRQIGKKLSDNWKRNISEKLKGRKLSEETKKKMGASKKGIPLSEEHKRLLSLAKKNKPMSEAQLRALESCKQWHISHPTRPKEWRDKISASHRARRRPCQKQMTLNIFG